MAFKSAEREYYQCLKADAKLTVGIKSGAKCVELDTGDKFVFDGTKWNLDLTATTLNGSFANQKTAIIAINTALSDAVDLAASTLVGISMSAAWDAATITFDVSNDGTNYGPLYYGGSEYTISEAAAGRRITLDPVALLPWRYVKVRSGVAGAVVNQLAARTITLWTKPV